MVVMAALSTPAHALYGPIPFDPDPAFGSGGVSRAALPPEFSPRRVYVADDGSIYTLTVGLSAGEPTHYVTRRDAAGAVDGDFGDAGTVTQSDAALPGEQLYLGLCTDPASGAIYLVGATDGEISFIVRRFLADGTPDDGWGAEGLLTVPMPAAPEPYAQGCAVQADGKLVVVGSWSALDATARGLTNRSFVARLTATGELDGGFADAGVHGVEPFVFEAVQFHYAMTHVEVDGLGDIFVAGHATDPRFSSRDLIAVKLTPAGATANPYGIGGFVRVNLAPSDEQVTGLRVNSGGRLVAGLLHTAVNGSGNSQVTTVRLTLRGDVDVTYGCAGLKSGPVASDALVPVAGAFDGSGAALFLGVESADDDYESVVRTSGLPELATGGSSGEEIAHGCPSNEVLTGNIGGSSMPAGLLALFGFIAAFRRLSRR